ncbi:MAG: hypothetical protein ABI946_10820 [Chthoniobacterales bacterium]
MRVFGQSKTWQAGSMALVVLLLLSQAVEARSRRHRRPNPVTVAIEPFLFVRSVVHAVADPIIYNAPRVLATPIRAAHARHVRVFRGREVDESELDEDRGHYAEPVEDEPIRVAYYSRTQRTPPPRRERATDDDSDDMDNGLRQARADEDFNEDDGPQPTVGGGRAVLRNGIAHAPASAPQSVKDAIQGANSLRHKPYIWGGGHGSFSDRGYDCSGTVSFALHQAGALSTPLPSTDFLRYGERGRGRWITIYARPGHTFAVIAGLRLDTTDFRNGGNTGPRWHADQRDTRGYVARHPAGM